ncbi:hypothetical protein [Allocoleopsis franciscana]|uniref:Uncharacterized protein n=1 Tax=Allocoleopsis franciscana PCC 7113 TaxID=1173027 RepID=K9WJ89_9CYAN|nr:hypothetical protein [Allocoleopsis franciscana]AFZ19881.1 hypothetical protein Mic7113_4180 [Allocoleopsis franciscana PCC 7113]
MKQGIDKSDVELSIALNVREAAASERGKGDIPIALSIGFL